jgi:hypothetical protein
MAMMAVAAAGVMLAGRVAAEARACPWKKTYEITCITFYILQGGEGMLSLSHPEETSILASERKGQIGSDQSELPYRDAPSN